MLNLRLGLLLLIDIGNPNLVEVTMKTYFGTMYCNYLHFSEQYPCGSTATSIFITVYVKKQLA